MVPRKVYFWSIYFTIIKKQKQEKAHADVDKEFHEVSIQQQIETNAPKLLKYKNKSFLTILSWFQVHGNEMRPEVEEEMRAEVEEMIP